MSEEKHAYVINNRRVMVVAKKIFFFLLIVVSIIVVFNIFVLTSPKNHSHNHIINENIVHIQSFDISSNAEDIQTSVNGTIFVERNEEFPTIQIIASVDIDSTDWGGITFYIPKNWYVSNIMSSYPESTESKIPKDNIVILTTGKPDYEYNTMIQIGRQHENTTNNGGSGTVVFDIVPGNEKLQSEDLVNIMISLGTDDDNISGTDWIEIPVILKEDELKN